MEDSLKASGEVLEAIRSAEYAGIASVRLLLMPIFCVTIKTFIFVLKSSQYSKPHNTYQTMQTKHSEENQKNKTYKVNLASKTLQPNLKNLKKTNLTNKPNKQRDD